MDRELQEVPGGAQVVLVPGGEVVVLVHGRVEVVLGHGEVEKPPIMVEELLGEEEAGMEEGEEDGGVVLGEEEAAAIHLTTRSMVTLWI